MKRNQTILITLAAAVVLGAIGWIALRSHNPVAPTTEQRRIDEIESTLPLPKAWSGDLDGMLERRLVRILVPYSKTLYFLDFGQARGVVYDAGKELEKWLNRKYGSKTLPIRVVFIPTSREHLLADLVDGHGDIAAGNLTITPERSKRVDFTETGLRNVTEIVVTGPSCPEIVDFNDLSDIPIYVRKSSSYYEHLTELVKDQNVSLEFYAADEVLEDADLLEMVHSGLLPLAIVDDHKARFWSQFFDKLVLREDLAINQGGQIGWAIRKGSPLLAAELNEFGRIEGRNKGLANMLLKRYLGSTRHVLNATNKVELEKFDDLAAIFRKHAEAYSLDPVLLMAQGYQESRLDQSVRSHAGAVGIMQVLPKTASSKAVQIDDIEENQDKNIEAGAKYMRHLIDTYLDDPEIDERNKLLLGLAAYNAGPGNMRKIRKKTVELGLDKNVWFNNVEHGSAKVIGRETTQYVSNIYKYYLAYLLVEERRNVRKDSASITTP